MDYAAFRLSGPDSPLYKTLEVCRVTKRYPAPGGVRTVLNAVTFNVPPGMNLGVLGKNGAGKSTLINLLVGAEFPDSGTIRRNGLRLSWPIGRSGIQASISARSNVKFICRVTGANQDRAVDFVRGFTELGRYMDMPVRTYSAGMRARLGFALSMVGDYDTYLVDEGFGAGDKRFTERAHRIFAERCAKANMICIAHSPSVIRKFCNRVAILDKGKFTIYEDIEQAIRIYERL